MEMTIVEYLNQRIAEDPSYEDKIVKIGSMTNYFFIGPVKTFINNLGEYSEKCRASFEEMEINARCKYRMLRRNPPKVADTEDEDLDAVIKAYMEEVEHWEKQLRSKQMYWIHAKQRLEMFKPLTEREFIEARDSIVDEGVENIKISGYETGRMWMLCEVGANGEFSIACNDYDG